MKSYDAPSNTGRNLVLVLVLILVALFFWVVLRGGAPKITAQVPKAVGARRSIDVNVRQSSGIRAVSVSYEQNGKDFLLFHQETGQRHWFFTGMNPRALQLQVPIGRMAAQGLRDGAATLIIQARAANLRDSTTTWKKPVEIRSVPPQLALLTTQHYIHQGGCDMAVYHVSRGTTSSGVEMGGVFFAGHALPGAPAGTMFSIFAFPYNAPANSKPVLIAKDDAGNQNQEELPAKTYPHPWPPRKFELPDSFLAKVVPAIMANTPSLQDEGSLIKNFYEINHDLRAQQTQELIDLAPQSANQFYWHGAFLQLGHSAVEAHYADHRIYTYKGKIIDDEYHLGYDLAAVAHTPVLASNDGKVIMAKYFGIYGNCIVIDHGFGLMTLYAHLNDFVAHPGDFVKKGQLIAHSDSTGLAGGDHLHFSVLLDGQQVDPAEWWDPHWIHDRIQAKIQEFAPGAQETL